MEIVFLLPDRAALKPLSSAKPPLTEDLCCASTAWYLKHFLITTEKQAMIMPLSEMKNWSSEKRCALPIIAKCIPSFHTYSAGTYLLHARPTPGIHRYSAEPIRSRIQICTCLTPKPLPFKVETLLVFVEWTSSFKGFLPQLFLCCWIEFQVEPDGTSQASQDSGPISSHAPGTGCFCKSQALVLAPAAPVNIPQSGLC